MKNPLFSGERSKIKTIWQLARYGALPALTAGSLLVAGCADTDPTYETRGSDVCAIIGTRVLRADYEADRWANNQDIPRLTSEIQSSTSREGVLTEYAICFDGKGTPHATPAEPIDAAVQMLGQNPHGYTVEGIEVPGVISATAMAAEHQTGLSGIYGS